MSNTKAVKITEQSKALFLAYWADRGNWSGTPLVGGNVVILGEKEDRGNLTQLKRAGLLTTWLDEGCTWIQFTELGKEYGESHDAQKSAGQTFIQDAVDTANASGAGADDAYWQNFADQANAEGRSA